MNLDAPIQSVFVELSDLSGRKAGETSAEHCDHRTAIGRIGRAFRHRGPFASLPHCYRAAWAEKPSVSFAYSRLLWNLWLWVRLIDLPFCPHAQAFNQFLTSYGQHWP